MPPCWSNLARVNGNIGLRCRVILQSATRKKGVTNVRTIRSKYHKNMSTYTTIASLDIDEIIIFYRYT